MTPEQTAAIDRFAASALRQIREAVAAERAKAAADRAALDELRALALDPTTHDCAACGHVVYVDPDDILRVIGATS